MDLNETKELLIGRIIFYLEPYLEKLHNYSIEGEGGRIELIGATDDKAASLFVLTRIFISEEFKKIYISGINLPEFMRHQGIGRKLIKVIYKTATELRYELFIALVPNSFYESLIKRGALKCEKINMLKIVDSTMLD
ncbi:MAG TPA: GNAT family N-acetyltransferase [Candidatus Limnocylindrales bacterium]|nr:GNAT family N-acetyltransferase [Candidatus Limnocylindrales bacterium]